MDTAPERREFWRHYLATCPSYGTPEQRSPEYQLSWEVLRRGGCTDRDLIVDVGCGDQGFDLFLRRIAGYRGQYLGVDGSIDGTELNWWVPTHQAEWFVCLEVLEHLTEPFVLLSEMLRQATKGVVISTPNPDVVDVIAVDPTHVTPISIGELECRGMDISTHTLNPGRGEGDTLFAWRYT